MSLELAWQFYLCWLSTCHLQSCRLCLVRCRCCSSNSVRFLLGWIRSCTWLYGPSSSWVNSCIIVGPIYSAQRRKETLRWGAERKAHWWCSCEQSSSRHRRFRTSRCHDMKWRSAIQFQRKTSPQTIARSEIAARLHHLTSNQTKWRKGSTLRLEQPILPLSL